MTTSDTFNARTLQELSKGLTKSNVCLPHPTPHLEVFGIESGIFCTQSMKSTTELWPFPGA